MINRRLREMTAGDIAKIAATFEAFDDGSLTDEKGYCAAPRRRYAKQDYIFTPGRYVGIEEQEDDLPAPRPGVFFVYAIRCQD
jgi:type I restriction enzyme M protein